MTTKMWRSKDDVLNDLAEYTGIRTDLDDSCVVRGFNRPPPVRANEGDDEEISLRFGGYGDQRQLHSGNAGPDLPGITQMLRMVFDSPLERPPSPVLKKSSPRVEDAQKSHRYVIQKPKQLSPRNKVKSPTIEEGSLKQKLATKNKIKSPTIQEGPQKPRELSPKSEIKTTIEEVPKLTVKSKLNPFVSEFVPRSLQVQNSVDGVANNNNVQEVNSKKKETFVENDLKSMSNKEIDNEINKKEDVIKTAVLKIDESDDKSSTSNASQLSESELERQKMIDLLKNKIRAASKEDSLEKKREKNVAISALIRLHSGPPAKTSNTSSSVSTPKCPSPPVTSSKPSSVQENVVEPPPPIEKPIILFTPDYFANTSSVKCPPTVVNVEDNEHIIPEPIPLEAPLETPSPNEVTDPCIRDSISKVQNWLNPEKKPKAKTLAPHIGPVMFRRKGTMSPESSSVVSKKTEAATPSPIPAFVPSQYASQLAKDLEARVKRRDEEAKKAQPPLDIWTKLETELKARDKKIIEKRHKEQAENVGITSSNENSRSSSRQCL